MADTELAGVSGYAFSRTPLSNITPFTYRDHGTFQRVLYGLVDFINETHLVEINALVDEIETIINDGADSMNQQLAAAIEQFTDMITDTNVINQTLVTETLATVRAEILDSNTANTDAVAASNAANAELVSDTTTLFELIVESINNKSGPVDIQRVTLTAPYTLNIDPVWPTNQPVQVVLKQDATGGHPVTLGANINGSLVMATAPNAATEFALIPDGAGAWAVRPPIPNRLTRENLNNSYVSKLPATDSFTGKTLASLNGQSTDSGHPYSVRSNAPANAYKVENGWLVHSLGEPGLPSAAYAGVVHPRRVDRISADFRFESGANQYAETVVLIVSLSAFTTEPDFSDSACHFVMGQTNWSYEVLEGSPFSTPVIASGVFATPLTSDADYSVSIDFVGDTATINLPDGTTATATDSRIASYRGDHATLESYAHTGSSLRRVKISGWDSRPESSYATLTDVDNLGASLPSAPVVKTFSPGVAYSLELPASPAVVPLNTDNLSLSVKFPPSGRVKWEAEIWCWMNSDNAAGADGFLGIMNGVTLVSATKAISNQDTRGLFRASGVVTDTPGTTRLYQLAGYASAAPNINYLTDNNAGLTTVFTLTPLAN